MSRRPTSWSHSAWAGATPSQGGCMLKYKLGKIDRLAPKETSPAMERGIEIHSMAEHFLLGDIKGIPKPLRKFETEFKNLKRLDVSPEAEWVITERGEHTHMKDWAGAWLRAKIDAHLHFPKDKELVLIDYKTGRLKLTPSQGDLYAWLSGYFYTENVTDITVEFWYLDQPRDKLNPYVQKFKAKDHKVMDKKWRERAKRLLTATKFPATPSKRACDRCPFRNDKTMVNGQRGPCNEWKKAGRK